MSKILLLVEGQKTEKQLFEQFYKLYGESDIEIVAYGTEIYTFYRNLKKYMQKNEIDYDSIDLPMFLYETSKHLGTNEKLNDMDFTDHILIFDFDPQDSKYSSAILIELMENFSNSTQLGKLYLNYPMVESFKDMDSLNGYFSRVADDFRDSWDDLFDIRR